MSTPTDQPAYDLTLVPTEALAKALLDRVDVGAVVLRQDLRPGVKPTLHQCMGETTGDAHALIGLLSNQIFRIQLGIEACRRPVPPEFTAGPGEDVEEPADG